LSGNCIVVDHGYGLQTIYGHLSQIAVHEGNMVERGQVMGTSGQTGMAGGDHIHFANAVRWHPDRPEGMVGQPLDQGSHREAHRPAGVQQLR
jgi:peptidase M23-like protein